MFIIDWGGVIDQNPELTIYPWKDSKRESTVDITNNLLTSPTLPGEYVYEAFAMWDKLIDANGWTSGEVAINQYYEI